jgi:hypothetical protein
MKSKFKNPTIVISFLVIACLLLAFKKNTANSYEHMFIITRNLDLDNVYVSTNKGRTRLKDLRKESQGDWDLSPLINEIERYEADGWVLQSTNPNGNLFVYWLKREKK